MSENEEPQVEETEEPEVEEDDVVAHSGDILSLQGLGRPEPDELTSSKSTSSIVC